MTHAEQARKHARELRRALTALLAQRFSNALLASCGARHLDHAQAGLERFRARGDLSALRTAALSTVMLLELALRRPGFRVAAREGSGGMLLELDAATAELANDAAARFGLSVETLIARSVVFYAGDILSAIMQNREVTNHSGG